MEKQILQVKEHIEVFHPTELPVRPTMPDDDLKAKLQDIIDEEITRLDDAKDITSYATALMNSIHALINAVHHVGVADRAIQLFDEIFISKMAMVGPDMVIKYDGKGRVIPPDGWMGPDLEHIMERDYSIYKSLAEPAAELELREKLLLESLVLKNIRKRLNPEDLTKWDSYTTLEKELGEVVDVNYSGGGIHERIAHVNVYGEPVLVKINFTEKKPKKKPVKYGKVKSLNKK